MQDDRIGRVIEAIHADPGRRWTLDGQAQAATMSRSSFSERRLRESAVTASALAGDLGYQSEAAFNRAFTRVIGRTPGSVRKAR